MTAKNKITYADAGVDIERGDEFVDKIKARVRSTPPASGLTATKSFPKP